MKASPLLYEPHTMHHACMKNTLLITGASRGLGRALAFRFSDLGWKVALVARHEEPLEDGAATIRARGGHAIALAYDIADKHAIHTLVGRATAALGNIDVLVNNASALGPTPLRHLHETACEDLEAVLATNVVGPFRLSKAVLGGMVLRKRGAIVNIGSDAAVSAYPGWGAYGASKAAFDHLGRIWAQELQGSGVHIFGIDPGDMDTAMHRAAIPDADPSTLQRPEDVAVRIANEIVARLGVS